MVFVDEGVVTTKTMAKFEYAPKYQNFEVGEKDLNLKCLGFVVGLSQDKGYVLYKTAKKSINSEKMLEYMKDLRKVYKKKGKIACYHDNCTYFDCTLVKDYCRENDIEIVFAPVY